MPKQEMACFIGAGVVQLFLPGKTFGNYQLTYQIANRPYFTDSFQPKLWCRISLRLSI